MASELELVDVQAGYGRAAPVLRGFTVAVPAGSVAMAGAFTGIYPRESPGGWRVIGRTEHVLWDERRDPPAVLRPGVALCFSATA